jgi:hypothetical protein
MSETRKSQVAPKFAVLIKCYREVVLPAFFANRGDCNTTVG